MKAIVRDTHGLTCVDVEKPTAGDGEVLIRVRAASVNALDRHIRAKRPGRDVAGQVEAVGPRVTRFKPGDDVFGICRGAFAQYACARESALAVKPPNVTFEQAASVPIAGLTALQGLRDKGRIRAGQKILINGATGGVGTFAVQLARSFGAEVTGVCSAGKVALVRSIGADHVIDYARNDFTNDGRRYDLIFDVAASRSFRACTRVLNPGGVHVGVGGSGVSMPVVLARWLAALVLSRLVRERFVTFIAKVRDEDLALLADLLAAGTISPVVDRIYRLQEVPDAIRYMSEGHARGKVASTV